MCRSQSLLALLLLLAAACGDAGGPDRSPVELLADLPEDREGILQADFGQVGLRATAPLGLSLRNTTDRRQEVRLAFEGAAFFGPDRLTLEPHQTLPFSLLMRPRELGPVEGAVAIVLPDEVQWIALRGQVVEGCLAGTEALHFEEAPEGCFGQRHFVEITNTCDHAIRLMSVVSDPPDFPVVALPILPAPVEAGGVARIGVATFPMRAGERLGRLRIEDDAGAPHQVALAGVGVPGQRLVDEHVQGLRPDADRLYVVDDTSALAPHAERLASWARAVEGDLPDVDVQAAVTVASRLPTEGCTGTGAFGRLLPTDRSERRVLDRLDLLDGTLERRFAMPFCSEAPNELFAAAERAVELMGLRDDPTTAEPDDGNFGLRRPGLPLQVVLVTAADDESPGDLDEWYARLRELRGRYRVRFTALVAGDDCQDRSIPERVERVFEALREPVLHLCDEPAGGPWVAVPNEEPLRSTFPLAAVPLDRNDDRQIDEVVDDFAVFVDGERIPQRTEDDAYRWEALIGPGEVRFAPGHVPEELQQVTFEYLPACGT